MFKIRDESGKVVAEHGNKKIAEKYAELLGDLPSGYSLQYVPSRKAFGPAKDWLASSPRAAWRETFATAEQAVAAAVNHAEAAPQRAEAACLAAAEEIISAEAAVQTANLATPRQVDYILSLLAQRGGAGGGFFNGPTDRAGIALLTKTQASAYITSLKEEY